MKQAIFKVLVAGDASVGKTTMLHRYIQGEFIDSTTMTVGVDFFTKKVQYPDLACILQLWDIGGQERFRFMVQNYLRGAHGALLLFDTTSMTSFVNIQKWYQLLRKNDPLLPIVLVGTKKDLEEFSMVGDYYAKLTQEKYNMIDYIKTSAKLDLNITQAFEVILKHLLKTSIIGWGDMDYERERKMNALREKVEELNEKIEHIMQRLFQGGDDLSDVRIKYEGYRQQIDDINAELHELETEA